jgi:membrane protein YqaA with SNARE-associated domain
MVFTIFLPSFSTPMIAKVLTVAGLASFEIYAAIPAGFAFGLSPFIIFIAAVAGGFAGILITAFLGDRIQKIFKKKKKTETETKKSLGHRIWEKYGMIGLGFFGTMTIGAPASIAVGVGFNAKVRKLAIWCCMGVIARCMLFTAIGHYGLQLF